MITLFIMGLVGTGVAFAAMPVVVFALMLETCAERKGNTVEEAPAPSVRELSSGLSFAE